MSENANKIIINDKYNYMVVGREVKQKTKISLLRKNLEIKR